MSGRDYSVILGKDAATGEPKPIEVSDGALKTTAANPDTPEEGDADKPGTPTTAYLMVRDPVTGFWYPVQATIDPDVVLGDRRGVLAHVLSGHVLTQPEPETLFALPPTANEPAQIFRIVPTDSTTTDQAICVIPPLGYWGIAAPGDADRGAHVRTVGLVKANLHVGGAPVADLNPVTAITPAYGRTSFGQIRVAQREVLFENVQTYSLDTRAWATRTVGAGSVTYSSTSGVTSLAVSGASGDVAEISTHTHFPYEPGATTHKILTLKHSDAGQAGQTREWGFGTLDDGFWFRLSGTSLFVVRRSSSSGVATDADAVARSSWDDPLDGTGPSGLSLDLTQINQWEIDFQWLSAGVVRYWIDGILAHTIDLRGAIDLPATRTGQLPLRVTVTNTGASSAATLSYVCSVVYRDGGTPTRYVPGSYPLSAPKTAIGTTFTPALGIRMAATLSGRPNRKIVIPRLARVSNASGRGTVRLLLNPATITGGTWNAVPNAPWLEYNEGITSITGGTIMTEAFLPNTADVQDLDGDRAFALNGTHLRRVADNSSGDTIVFTAAAYLGNIDIVSLLATFNTLG